MLMLSQTWRWALLKLAAVPCDVPRDVPQPFLGALPCPLKSDAEAHLVRSPNQPFSAEPGCLFGLELY